MYEFNNFYNKVVNSRVDSMPAVEGVWSRHDGLAGWNVELSQVRWLRWWWWWWFWPPKTPVLLWSLIIREPGVIDCPPSNPSSEKKLNYGLLFQDDRLSVISVRSPGWLHDCHCHHHLNDLDDNPNHDPDLWSSWLRTLFPLGDFPMQSSQRSRRRHSRDYTLRSAISISIISISMIWHQFSKTGSYK